MDLIEKAIDIILEADVPYFKVENDVIKYTDIANVGPDVDDGVKITFKDGTKRIVASPLSQDFMKWFTKETTT